MCKALGFILGIREGGEKREKCKGKKEGKRERGRGRGRKKKEEEEEEAKEKERRGKKIRHILSAYFLQKVLPPNSQFSHKFINRIRG